MSVVAYSYRFKKIIALLNEEEYARVDAHIDKMFVGLKTGELSDQDLKIRFLSHPEGQAALKLYREITGRDLDESPGLMHHVSMSGYGRLCPSCDKPFRSPRAKLCAECGYQLPEGEVAGPLTET